MGQLEEWKLRQQFVEVCDRPLASAKLESKADRLEREADGLEREAKRIEETSFYGDVSPSSVLRRQASDKREHAALLRKLGQ